MDRDRIDAVLFWIDDYRAVFAERDCKWEVGFIREKRSAKILYKCICRYIRVFADIYVYLQIYMYWCICTCIHMYASTSCEKRSAKMLCTGWRRPIECLKLQVIFRKRATHHRALLRKTTYENKAPCDSTPPCTCICRYICTGVYVHVHTCMHVPRGRHTCTYVCVYMYICMYMRMCRCI